MFNANLAALRDLIHETTNVAFGSTRYGDAQISSLILCLVIYVVIYWVLFYYSSLVISKFLDVSLPLKRFFKSHIFKNDKERYYDFGAYLFVGYFCVFTILFVFVIFYIKH